MLKSDAVFGFGASFFLRFFFTSPLSLSSTGGLNLFSGTGTVTGGTSSATGTPDSSADSAVSLAGGNTITNQPNEFWNKYNPGAGVGASNIATRRAKMIHATSCSNGQQCGRFYTELGQNQIRPSQYTNYNS